MNPLRKFTLTAVAAFFAATSLTVSTKPIEAKDGVGIAIAGGLIAGAAIGAAIASKKKHSEVIYVKPAPKPKPPKPFSPAAGIVCYPKQHACYKNGGAYSGHWTHRIYG